MKKFCLFLASIVLGVCLSSAVAEDHHGGNDRYRGYSHEYRSYPRYEYRNIRPVERYYYRPAPAYVYSPYVYPAPVYTYPAPVYYTPSYRSYWYFGFGR